MAECGRCGDDLPSVRSDGLYGDGDTITCAGCRTVNHVSFDGEDEDGPYTSSWTCEHGLSDEHACEKCDDEDYEDVVEKTDICIRDDSTECSCSRCGGAEDRFWREQGGDPSS